MKGIIVINPFNKPQPVLYQANRMKEEFKKRQVDCEIVDNGHLKYYIDNNRLISKFGNVDFCVFFDKDKYMSNAISNLGIKLFNSHESIRICDDKGETYLALQGKGVKIPKTIFAPLCYIQNQKLNMEDADIIAEQLNFPVIVKKSYGSLGEGVYLAESNTELFALMRELVNIPHLYQEYIGYKRGTDIRVIVVGGKIIASMERVNKNDFRSNISLGGVGKSIDISDKFKNVCEKVSSILGLDYCGIDLLYDGTDYPVVCEVNSNAFMSGIEKTTGINVAGAYAEHIINIMNKKTSI